MGAQDIIKFQWKKGTSGNPAGKPKGAISIKTRLENLMDREMTLENLVTGEIETASVREFWDRAIAEAGARGNTQMISEAWDRLYGKVAQKVDMKSSNPMQELTPDVLIALAKSKKKK